MCVRVCVRARLCLNISLARKRGVERVGERENLFRALRERAFSKCRENLFQLEKVPLGKGSLSHPLGKGPLSSSELEIFQARNAKTKDGPGSRSTRCPGDLCSPHGDRSASRRSVSPSRPSRAAARIARAALTGIWARSACAVTRIVGCAATRIACAGRFET